MLVKVSGTQYSSLLGQILPRSPFEKTIPLAEEPDNLVPMGLFLTWGLINISQTFLNSFISLEKNRVTTDLVQLDPSFQIIFDQDHTMEISSDCECL